MRHLLKLLYKVIKAIIHFGTIFSKTKRMSISKLTHHLLGKGKKDCILWDGKLGGKVTEPKEVLCYFQIFSPGILRLSTSNFIQVSWLNKQQDTFIPLKICKCYNMNIVWGLSPGSSDRLWWGSESDQQECLYSPRGRDLAHQLLTTR